MKDLNLIPKSYLKAKKDRMMRIYYTLIVVIVGVVLFFSIAVPLVKRFGLQAEKNDIEKKVKSTNNYVTIENQFKTLNELFKLRETQANGLMGHGIDVITILEKIEEASPDKLFFTAIGINGNDSSGVQVSLGCISPSEDEVATFVNYLRNGGYFENIVISSISKVPITSVQAKSFNPVNTKGRAAADVNKINQKEFQCTSAVVLYLKGGK